MQAPTQQPVVVSTPCGQILISSSVMCTQSWLQSCQHLHHLQLSQDTLVVHTIQRLQYSEGRGSPTMAQFSEATDAHGFRTMGHNVICATSRHDDQMGQVIGLFKENNDLLEGAKSVEEGAQWSYGTTDFHCVLPFWGVMQDDFKSTCRTIRALPTPFGEPLTTTTNIAPDSSTER